MPEVHPSAVVETDSIAADVSIGEFAVVREGARLGEGVVVHPHVVIEADVEIGAGTEILKGAYLGRSPRAVGSVLREPSFERRLTVGPGCSVGAHSIVYYDVEIGAETLIADSAGIRERSRVGSRVVIGRAVSLDREVTVGDGARVMDKTHLTGGVRVGEGAFLGPLVATTNDSSFGREGYREDLVRGPTIEAGAMIGAGASLLPGVVIGRSAIVGSGAVVTRDVPAETTVLGMPARPMAGGRS
jgi:acetyltransferase-like isoleucine patch superfamily enzyme